MGYDQKRIRNRLVEELMRRLAVGFPRVFLQRGFFDEVVKVWPSIYVIEDIEVSKKDPKKRRGTYEREFMIVISFWISGVDTEVAYEKGNGVLDDLTRVVELDEFFAEPGEAKGLTIDYAQAEAIIRPFVDGKLEVNVGYRFNYLDCAPWAETK